MTFINPIEILNLEGAEISDIDNSAIKKAKRKLIADIELSDNGLLEYKGQQLTKSDCEQAINELGNPLILDFYIQINNNKLLNEFLVNGNEKIFESFSFESIYLLPEFVNFISPFFADKFDKAFLKSFQDKDIIKINLILKTEKLIKPEDLTIAYKSISHLLNEHIQTFDRIRDRIKNEEENYSEQDLDSISQYVFKNIPFELLNTLPIYFQSQLNKIATSINYLQIAIWNGYDITAISYDLLKYILELNIESVSKPTYLKNFEIVKKKHFERIENEKNAPILNKWAKVLVSLQETLKSLKVKELKVQDITNIVTQAVDIKELNSLGSFSTEIKNQIAYSIRNISVECWNVEQDIITAENLLNFATKIDLDNVVLQKLKEDRSEINKLKLKYEGILICYFCGKNKTNPSSSLKDTIYLETKRNYFPRRRVEYKSLSIDIPRCSSCATIHDMLNKGSSNVLWITVLISMISVFILTLANEPDNVGLAIISGFFGGMIIGCLIGLFINFIIKSSRKQNVTIKDDSISTLSKHPILRPYIKEGWQFTEPGA